MPAAFERFKRSALATAKRRGYGKRRTGAYVYGGARNKLGWVPSTQKKAAGTGVARLHLRRQRRGGLRVPLFGNIFRRHARHTRRVYTHGVMGGQRHHQSEEEKKAKRRAYYHAHKATINAKKRSKYTHHPRARRVKVLRSTSEFLHGERGTTRRRRSRSHRLRGEFI